jgi:penicillin-binding protein 1A
MMLQNVIKSGTATSVTLDKSLDTAGKTGKTQHNHDKWFVGYTPYYICGVWYGYEYPEPIVDSVSNRSVKIWDDVMSAVHQNHINGGKNLRFEICESIIKAEYCADSGLRMTEACKKDARGNRTESGYFIKGSEPTKFCDRHVLVDYDTEYGGLADDECENTEKVALIYAERSFPMQIYVTDAEYVWRDIGSTVPPNTSEHQPFYANLLAENEYCGISRSEKQFNRYCKRHFSYYAWKEKKDE